MKRKHDYDFHDQFDYESYLDDLIESFERCINYIINEAQKSPDDSVRDIANEAFYENKLPLEAEWSEDDGNPITLLDKESEDD